MIFGELSTAHCVLDVGALPEPLKEKPLFMVKALEIASTAIGSEQTNAAFNLTLLDMLLGIGVQLYLFLLVLQSSLLWG